MGTMTRKGRELADIIERRKVVVGDQVEGKQGQEAWRWVQTVLLWFR